MTDLVRFERALFFGWYCGLGDCTFCYMSTLKNKLTDPKKGRRSFASIFAETLLCRELGWGIEFISGGYDSYSRDELVFLVHGVYEITGQKQWLNIGSLSLEELKLFAPYLEGFAGAIETINWELRKKVCPSKHLEPILKSYEHCDELGLRKAMTMIVGLGETLEDFKEFERFVREHGISRVTFYALNAHPDTPFTGSPDKDYYAQWIVQAREAFPELEIIAGAWTDKTHYYSKLLKAGADHITKIPAIRKFGSPELQAIEQEVAKAGKEFSGTLTKYPEVKWDDKISELSSKLFSKELKKEIRKKLNVYLKQMNH